MSTGPEEPPGYVVSRERLFVTLGAPFALLVAASVVAWPWQLLDLPAAVGTLTPPSAGLCNYYKYIAVSQTRLDRKALKAELRQHYGVSLAGEVYELPLQRQPIFQQLGRDPLPDSEQACSHHICLPIFPSMTDHEALRVVEALQKTLG